MSIQSFINASKLLLNEGYYQEALCLCCSAIDAYSSKHYSNKNNNSRYKQFLKDHFRTICEIGFPGISASCIKIKVNANIEDLRPDSDGYVTMEQIIYHVLRCGLVHNCSVPEAIEFSEDTIIGDWGNRFYIPKPIILGLIASIEEKI